MSYPLVILAMGGIGDSIFQRPFVLEHVRRQKGRGLYLRTPWPELFEDIPGIRFVYPDSMRDLRTQSKNMDAQPDERWVRPPLQARRLRPMYRLRDPDVSVMEELRHGFKLPGRFRPGLELPSFGKPPVRYRKYAVIRPVTLRKEWLAPARSPLPGYVAETADILRELGYRIVSVAHVDGKREWLEGRTPEADKTFHAGELGIRELMALIEGASLVVGGVGFILPAAIAYRTPVVILGGGQGGYNAPEMVTSPSMDLARVRWILPDDYCRCRHRLHACPKEITGLESKLLDAVAELEDLRAAA